MIGAVRRFRRFLLAASLAFAVPQQALAQPGDWGATRDPFDKGTIARYKGILARNPHDGKALAKLLEMYRRYRTVDLLKEEYGKVIAKDAKNWAALVVLGRLHRATGDDPRALEVWTRAVAARDSDAQTWLAIGEIHKAATKNKEARAAYEKALAQSAQKDMKKKALRALADLALAATPPDLDGANAYFKQFLDLDPKNAQLWLERGDAMLAAGRREIALESYAAAEKLLGGDPARRVEVVARRGQALEGMGKDDEAVTEYRRAIKLAPKGYYLEVELTGRIVDIFRRKQALPTLLAQYEKEWGLGRRGHFEWSTLGKLYEETGAQDKAIAALKKAVAKAPWELDTQRRLIQLLENSGRDDEALAQYEAVVRAAPGEARFQIDLSERYWRRGNEKKALDTLKRLLGRFPSDAGVISAIADLYQRWGKEDLAIAEYERLAKLEPDDPSHVVTLGEQYWQKGDKARAMATWKKLANSGKAVALAKLGEVMAEHGQENEALAHYARAIKLDDKNPEFYKGRARVYEGKKLYAEALADWEKVLALLGTKASDRIARRDARRSYVATLVRYTNRETAKRDEWIEKFKKGDVEAGYFLVEYWAKRPKKGEPIATLEQLRKRVPDDWELLTELVKNLRKERRYERAIELLKELAAAQPSREREVYMQISEIKTEERKDDEAEHYQKLAVAKSPRDPTGHQRMAERYVEMQRFTQAIESYETVLKLDVRNTKAAFALSQLYVQTGHPKRAAELLRTVVRTALSDDDVRRAAREAIDLEEMTDSLGELEKVLAPLSFMMAHKAVYRQVLVELYLRYVPRLVHRERHGNAEVRKVAREELKRIGGHGLQPLLQALRDEKEPAQQRVAVSVLGHLGNKGAAAPLVHMARQEPSKDVRHIGTLQESLDREVRVDALVAAGRLGDPRVLDDVLPLMDHPELTMKEAATFTLGRSGDRRAVPALVTALNASRPSVQTLACLGLAQIDEGRSGPALIAALADTRKLDATRAACAYAIGARKLAAGVPALLAALTDNRGEAQRLAAWALGQIGDPKTLGPLIRAYFARAGRASDELVWAIGRVGGAGLGPSSLGALADYPLARGKYDPVAAVGALPGSLPKPPPQAKLVIDHADDIAKGLTEALAEHRDVVVSVLADLDGASTHLSLGALAPRTVDPKLAAAIAKVGAAIAPRVSAHLTSEDPKVRALAISVLAKLDGGRGAEAAIEKALSDPMDQVRAAAMRAIPVLAHRRGRVPKELLALLVKTLQRGAWADRPVAVRALAKLGAGGDLALLHRSATDSSSFVREAVAESVKPEGQGLDVLLTLSRDEIPQVRAAAAKSLAASNDPRAKQRRVELANDPEPVVQRAITGS